MNKKSELLKKRIAKLQSKIGRSYDADHAPDLLTKWKRLKEHKVWIDKHEKSQARSEFLASLDIHEAVRGIFQNACEILNAQSCSGLGSFVVTKDKMEWSIIIQQIGVRNPKTGSIDKRLHPKYTD